MTQTVVVDIDGVIADSTGYDDDRSWEEKYRQAKVLPGAHKGLRQLKQVGFTVLLFTARWAMDYEATEDWLTQHGFHQGYHYDRLEFGKPPAVLYVDDRGFRFNGNWQEVLDAVTEATQEDVT